MFLFLGAEGVPGRGERGGLCAAVHEFGQIEARRSGERLEASDAGEVHSLRGDCNKF